MRAYTLDFASRRGEFRDLAEPVRQPGEVLLRVGAGGVCGTDRELAAFHIGEPPAGEPFLVLGHEACAQVIEADPMGHLQVGDWVAPMVRRACAAGCPFCVRGRVDQCSSGGYRDSGIVGRHGYFREYVSEDPRQLIRVPAALAEYAVLLEPLSVVEKAVTRALQLSAGPVRQALVVGAGPIGCLTALVLTQRGFPVAVHSMEPPDHPRVAWLHRIGVSYNQPVKADLAFEAAGVGAAAEVAVKSLAPNGVCAILGARDARVEMPFRTMILENQTVFGSVNADRASWEVAVEDLARTERGLLETFVERRRFDDLPRSLSETAPQAAKLVHILH
ncbi:MAG: alcohol dehydrogenase catalytic domain-containing protein [Acidobacteria bacterium]|nr:alcohol dehydrogenase catalytic domain-containing protein [Acidobacteriota bacterium]